MSEPIKITLAMLQDIKNKAEALCDEDQLIVSPAVMLAMVREIELRRSRRGWLIQAMLRDIELSIAAVNGSNESEDFVEDYCKCDREVGICCQYCQIFHTLKRCKSQIESEVEI